MAGPSHPTSDPAATPLMPGVPPFPPRNPMADGGICATLRDLARFGQQNGQLAG